MSQDLRSGSFEPLQLLWPLCANAGLCWQAHLGFRSQSQSPQQGVPAEGCSLSPRIDLAPLICIPWTLPLSAFCFLGTRILFSVMVLTSYLWWVFWKLTFIWKQSQSRFFFKKVWVVSPVFGRTQFDLNVRKCITDWHVHSSFGAPDVLNGFQDWHPHVFSSVSPGKGLLPMGDVNYLNFQTVYFQNVL